MTRNGDFTPIDLTEKVLGVPFFYDRERSLAARENPQSLPEDHISQRRMIHVSVLRSLAHFRREERMSMEGEPFDNKYWEPTPNQYADLAADFEPHAKRLRLINNLESYVNGYKIAEFETGLRPHQQDAFDNLLHFMQKKGVDTTPEAELTKSGYMDLPTAYGKTFIMTELVKAMSDRDNEGNITKPPRTLVLVPRKIIGKQIIGKDAEKGFGKFAHEIEVSQYFGKKQELNGDVVVMTYQSFSKRYEDGTLDDQSFDLLICDEAHHGLGAQIKENLEEFRSEKLAIGLTASTEYARNKHVGMLFPELIHRTDLRTAIEAGILSGLQCWSYNTDSSIVIDNIDREQFTHEELAPLIEDGARNKHAIQFMKSFIEKGLQGIVPCIPGNDCEHAYNLAKEARKAKLIDPVTGEERLMRVEAISHKQEDHERDAILARFEAGEVDALTFVNIITEGWDSEAAKFIINLCPTSSPVRAIQRLGRILRPNDKEQLAQVVEFIDKVEGGGGSRHQYTFMHALGEEIFYQGWVFENDRSGARGENDRKKLTSDDFPEEILAELARINAIPLNELVVTRKQTEPPPEGWLSMAELGETATGMSAQYIRKILIEAGYEGRIAKGEISTPTYYFPPEAVAYLRDNIVIDQQPNDWLNSKQLEQELDTTQFFVKRVAADLAIEGVQYRNFKNQLTTYYSPKQAARIREYISNVPVANAEEASLKSLANELGITEGTVRSYFTKKGITGTAKRIHEKGRFALFFTEAEAAKARTELIPPPVVEDGWLSISGIARVIGTQQERIARYLESTGELEQGKRMRAMTRTGRLGKAGLFFAPEISDKVIKEFKFDTPSPTWVTVKDLAKRYNVTVSTLEKTLDENGVARHSMLLPRRKGPVTLIDDEGQAAVDQVFGMIEKAKDGWMSMAELSRASGMSQRTIHTYFKTLSDVEEGTIMRMRGDKNLRIKHYSPAFSQSILAALQDQAAPTGWIGRAELAKRFNMSGDTVYRVLQEKGIETSSLPSGIFFPPEAAGVLDEIYGKVTEAPSDWLNINQMRKEINSTGETIRKFIEENPDLAAQGKTYRNKMGQLVQYYPETVIEQARANVGRVNATEAVRRVLGDEAATVEWQTAISLSTEFGLPVPTVKAILKRAKIMNTPVREQESGSLTVAYPALEARALIEARAKLPEAEAGWVTLSGMVTQSGATHGRIKRLLETKGLAARGEMRKDGAGREVEYFPPDVLSDIISSLQPDTVPEGWRALTDVSSELTISTNAILRMIRENGDNPTPLTGDDGISRIFLSPEHIEQAQKFAAIPAAGEGWMNMSEIAGQLGVHPVTVRNRLRRIALDEADAQVMKARHKNKPLTHYSPEIVARLMNES